MSGTDDDLTGDYPANTYKSLLHTDETTGLTASFQQVYDGKGTASTIEVSSAATRITNLTINGTTSFGDAAQVRTALGISSYPTVTFSTLSVAGQSDIVADGPTDTLTFVAGTNISLTTNAGADTLTINSSSPAVSDGDKGDITVSGSGAVWTVDNDAITYGQMQNTSTTDIILGRSSVGGGNIEEITCTSAGRALLDDANASAQRTTLGIVIGTNVQAYDDTLAALASYSATGLVTMTSADTFTGRTLVGTADQITITNGSGVSGNPTFSLPYALKLGASASGPSSIDFFEDSDNGNNYLRVTVPSSLSGNPTVTFQDVTGTVLVTGGTDVTISDGGTGASTAIGAFDNLSPLTTKGDILYHDGTHNVRLAAGAADTVLTHHGAGTDPTWEPAAVTYTDENAQDAVGGIFTDTSTIDFTYNDGAGTITADVKDDSISYSKIQNVSAPDKILGRQSGGAGDVEEIACTAAGRALLDDATASAQRTTLGLVIGTDVQAHTAALDAVTGTNTGDQNLFSTISVSGQSDIVADSTGDTFTLAAGPGITITTNAGTDTVTISGTSTVTVSETEVDFGSTPVGETTVFTVTDAAVSGTSKILLSLSGAAPTGKDQDELEMDSFHMWALPGSGSFSLYMRPLEGYVSDKFKINYMVG